MNNHSSRFKMSHAWPPWAARIKRRLGWEASPRIDGADKIIGELERVKEVAANQASKMKDELGVAKVEIAKKMEVFEVLLLPRDYELQGLREEVANREEIKLERDSLKFQISNLRSKVKVIKS
ncbi:hypothetical protein Pint_33621 [Pistacia integerrima]|uniref:Uncharacterized protein n=1 Tax=Pistacia integerrima TaxID=434235 RepID=A0ACC0X213_9ROSI|nr:hypothetical protein Pint_33621 [Pistacia integerrima]